MERKNKIVIVASIAVPIIVALITGAYTIINSYVNKDSSGKKIPSNTISTQNSKGNNSINSNNKTTTIGTVNGDNVNGDKTVNNYSKNKKSNND